MIAVSITDPREIELPNVGILNLKDAETGESFLVDTSDVSTRKQYRDKALLKISHNKTLFNSTGVDNIDIYTDRPYDKELVKFFGARQKRFRT